MLGAVLAAIITLAAVAAIALAVLYVRQGHARTHVGSKRSVKSIDTFGVAPSEDAIGFGTSAPARVSQASSASGSPSGALQQRFVAMGVFAAAVFGTLGLKVWSMQVLEGEDYSQKAAENLYTTVYSPAPRGIIYDADGIVLVGNRSVYTVLAEADVADDRDVVARLAPLLGIPAEVIRQRILDTSSGAQSSRVVEEEASFRSIAFIGEHIDAFPGITCETRTVRTYPYGALAAHALGYTGTASDEDLESVSEGRTLESGDAVGKSGIEAAYDDLLAGDHGTRRMLTDADGNVQQVVAQTDPMCGNDLYLTIKGPVQLAADQALRDLIAPDGELGGGRGTAGACVCIDVRDGGIVALANCPTYSPESFIGGIPQDIWDAFNEEESYYPLMNRVIAGAYPAASTYKAFTAMAALDCGLADEDSKYVCGGLWTGFGEEYAQACWSTSGHGTLDLIGGIANSCDVVFYDIAKEFYEHQDTLGSEALQDEIRRYGFGELTGIDIPGEVEGRVPTPSWKAEYFKDAPEEAQWRGGDYTNMIIGQGYVLVTPIQIACGYMGIATGKIMRPHLLKEVRNSLGDVVLTVQGEVALEPEQNAEDIALVHQGLKEVLTINGYDTKFFGDVDYVVAGKSGTAEVSGKDDYTWFACYAPADDPKYVCACLVEQGASPVKSSMVVAAATLRAAMEAEAGTIDATMTSVSSVYKTVAHESSGESSRSD